MIIRDVTSYKANDFLQSIIFTSFIFLVWVDSKALLFHYTVFSSYVYDLFRWILRRDKDIAKQMLKKIHFHQTCPIKTVRGNSSNSEEEMLMSEKRTLKDLKLSGTTDNLECFDILNMVSKPFMFVDSKEK